MNRLKQYLDTFSFRKYFYVFVGAVAVLCVFTPSFQITEEIKNQFSIQLPQLPLSPGELFVIKSNKGFLTAYSEGKKTSPLNFQKHLFAVSLYQDTALTLHGQFDLKKGHIFSHPKDYYFIKNLKVKYKNNKSKYESIGDSGKMFSPNIALFFN